MQVASEGIPDVDLAAKISHIPVTDRAVAINRLLSQRKLQIFKDGDALVYKEVKQDEAVKFKGLSSEDLLVYQIIQQSGNTGIWTKELKQKSNLPQTQIRKIFKSLEAKADQSREARRAAEQEGVHAVRARAEPRDHGERGTPSTSTTPNSSTSCASSA